MTKKEIRKKIKMLSENLHETVMKHRRGEITYADFTVMKNDVNKRLIELRRLKGEYR